MLPMTLNCDVCQDRNIEWTNHLSIDQNDNCQIENFLNSQLKESSKTINRQTASWKIQFIKNQIHDTGANIK